MGFLDSLVRKIRNFGDDIGSAVTGQPAHGLPTQPVPSALQLQAPPRVTAPPPNPMNPTNQFNFGSLINKGFDQVNPFDNGKTWQNPQGNGQNQSILHQITHNGLTNIVGDIVKPIVQLPVNLSNASANLAHRAAGMPQQTPQQQFTDPFSAGTVKASGATGTGKQLAGDVAQVGINALTPGIGKIVETGVGKVLGNVTAPILQKAASGVITGAVSGAPTNVAATYGEGNLTKDNIGTVARQGAISGALLGAAADAAPLAVKPAIDKVAPIVKQSLNPEFNGLRPNQVITDTRKLDTLNNARQVLTAGGTSAPVRNAVNEGLHQIKNDHGLDFISGSPANRTQRITQFLEQNGEAIPQYQKYLVAQGGYAKVPGSEQNLSDIQNEANTRPQADLQKQFEDAHNAGDTQTANKIAQQMGDPALSGQMLDPQVRQALLDKMNAKKPDLTVPEQALPGSAASELPQNIPGRSGKLQPGQVSKNPGETRLTKIEKNPSFKDTPTTPNGQLDAARYIEEQSKKQEQARQGEQPNLAGKLRNIKDDLKTKFLDSYAPIEDVLNKAGKNGATIDPEHNISYQIDRAIRSDTIGSQYVKDTGLFDLIKDTKDPKAFDQYLIAKHEPEFREAGKKTGRNAGADRQLVEQLAPEYEAQAQQLYKISHDMLDKAAEYGLKSKADVEALKKQYPSYVPFNRIFNEEELANGFKGAGAGKASLSKQTVVQKATGSDRVIESPLNSMLRKAQDIVDQGERNKAASMLTSYRDLPGNPFQLRELKSTETVGVKPVVSFLDEGKQRRFETTPEVAAAAKSLNREQLGLVGKIFSYPTRLLRLGATSLNPAFALANLSKDIASAFINSKHPFRTSIANPDVFMDALTAAFNHGSKQYSELVREGAGGTSFDIARNNPKQNIKAIRAEKNGVTRGIYTVTHPSQLIRAFENTIGRSEEVTRALQYYGNKKAFSLEGKTAVQSRLMAADAARNNTVNFARAGEYGRVLNSVLPYLNAGIQGSRTLLRNIKDRPVETATKIALTGFLPVAATTAWNLKDPQRRKVYDSISDYEKQGNIIIIGPHAKQDSGGRWSGIIKIPVSQEIANLNNIVRNGVETVFKDKNFDFKTMAADLMGTATSLNVGSTRQVLNQVTPQAVKPLVENATNQNLFTGNQVVPDAIKNLDAKDQFNKSTSGTAKVVGRLSGQSPLQIDNAIRTATGGLGQNIVNLSDQALAKTGIIKPGDVKGTPFVTSVGNRFNSAQGITPGSDYFSTLTKTAKEQHLAGSDFAQLNSITSKALDANGQPKALNEQDKLERYNILAASPNIAKVLSETNKQVAAKNGTAVDPLFDLPDDKQHLYYRLQATPYKSDDYDRLKEQNPWLQDLQAQRAKYFDTMNTQAGTPKTGAAPSEVIPFPNLSNVQDKMDKVGELSGAERAQYIADNPDLQGAYDKISQYTNDKRIAQGYDPFKAYPKASADVQSAINYYSTLPKGTGDRSGWIKSHPDLYAQMQVFYAQSAAWQLANNAGKAKYEGEELNQKALKAASSLGQYDIFKNPDGTYGLIGSSKNPIQSGATSPSGAKGGGGKSSGSSFAKRQARYVRKIHTVRAPKVFHSKPGSYNKIRMGSPLAKAPLVKGIKSYKAPKVKNIKSGAKPKLPILG